MISYMTKSTLTPKSIDSKILARIVGRGRGVAMIPTDFLDLGSRQAVDLALHRLVRKGTIRRLARGIYDYPKMHPVLGPLLPPPEAIAKAVAGRQQARLQPAGAYAANLLGLSEQVPAKVVFLTDARSRIVEIGTMTIQLRQTTPRNMATAGQLSGLVIQALRHLGKAHVTPDRIAHLKRTIPPSERRSLVKDIKFAPAWMHPILRALAED
jgi:uncharacterized protein DUF6088